MGYLSQARHPTPANVGVSIVIALLLIFIEHGLAPEARVACWQHRLTLYWKRCADGCHLDRQTDVLLRNAGFELQDLSTGYLGHPKTLLFMYEGMAKPPAAG